MYYGADSHPSPYAHAVNFYLVKVAKFHLGERAILQASLWLDLAENHEDMVSGDT